MITQTFKEYRFICKVALFILILVPLFLLFIDVVNNDLGPDPAKAMAHITGEWAMRLLLVTLAISPLRKLTGTTEWIHYRRMLG
jgi:sulfoxide reductase heme-binding subunit YedZ